MLNSWNLRRRAERTTQSEKSELKSLINVLNHRSAFLTEGSGYYGWGDAHTGGGQ